MLFIDSVCISCMCCQELLDSAVEISLQQSAGVHAAIAYKLTAHQPSTMLSAVLLAALAATAAAQEADWLDRGMRARMALAEVGPNKNKHVTTRCNPALVGSVAGCFDQSVKSVGNNDYPINAPEVSFPVDGKPWGLHLTGPYPDGLSYAVSWYTGNHSVGAFGIEKKPDTSKVAATVRYSTKGANGPWEKTVQGSVITYIRLYNGAPHNNYNYLSPYISHVVLDKLQPKTTYYYQVQTDNGPWSSTNSFKTMPVRNKEHKASPYPIKIGLIADVGQTVNSSATRDHIMANKPDMAILVADFTYADNYGAADPNNLTGIGGTNQQRWDSWHVLFEPFLKSTPLVHCAGNHEVEQANINAVINYTTTSFKFPENYPFQSYSARWPAPGVRSNFGDITQNLYSVTKIPGVATIMSMNNYVPFHHGTPQYLYFTKAFQEVNRKDTPWLIVQFHAPPYHTYYTHYKEMECFMSVWESIFYKSGVDVVLNGHVHAYERTHPVYKYKRGDCGAMYITIGDAGNIEGPYRNFVDETSIITNKTYCSMLKAGNSTPTDLETGDVHGWGPSYQRQAHPPNCPTLSFQPDYDVDGSVPGILVPSVKNPKLGFCQSSQPLWSAHRDPSFGHAILTLKSDTTASIAWYRNVDSQMVAADTTEIKRVPEKCHFKH